MVMDDVVNDKDSCESPWDACGRGANCNAGR